jgi:alpha-aminoadipate carrier protein LysW
MLAILMSAVATRKAIAITLAIAVIWYYLDWVREDEARENSLCPDCEGALEIAEVEVGEIAYCDECGTQFEIVSVEPLELTPVDDDEADEEEMADYYEDGDTWPHCEPD